MQKLGRLAGASRFLTFQVSVLHPAPLGAKFPGNLVVRQGIQDEVCEATLIEVDNSLETV